MSQAVKPASTLAQLPRVLVVDDEQANLSTFQRALRLRYEITMANSGAEALQVLKDSEVDVLVTDYAMPGMNGQALLEKARALRPNLPCIVVTAYAELDDVRDAMRSNGVVKLLMKPWDRETLCYWITYCVNMGKMRKTVADLQDATSSPSGSHRTSK